MERLREQNNRLKNTILEREQQLLKKQAIKETHQKQIANLTKLNEKLLEIIENEIKVDQVSMNNLQAIVGTSQRIDRQQIAPVKEQKNNQQNFKRKTQKQGKSLVANGNDSVEDTKFMKEVNLIQQMVQKHKQNFAHLQLTGTKLNDNLYKEMKSHLIEFKQIYESGIAFANENIAKADKLKNVIRQNDPITLLKNIVKQLNISSKIKTQLNKRIISKR